MQALKVSEGIKEENFIPRHSQFDHAVNIINLYGAQESRQMVKDIKDNWDTIVEDVLEIEVKNGSLILIGDFNCHIGNTLVKPNHSKVTTGGKLLKNENYVLVNALEYAKKSKK